MSELSTDNKLTAEQKVALIKDVAQTAFDSTETWGDDELGVALAYLFWAITDGGIVDWSDDVALPYTTNAREKFKEWFPHNHTVWLFIRT